MNSEEFLFRVCQYWVAAASARDASRIAYAPAREKVPEILLRLWKGRGKIGRGDVDGLRFDSELQALWIERGGFNAFIGTDIKRPDRVFYKKEQFYRNITVFARSSIRTRWAAGTAPDVSPMSALIARFRKEVNVDLSDDFKFVGTLVQQSLEGEGITLLGFRNLSAEDARAFGKSGLTTLIVEPGASSRKRKSQNLAGAQKQAQVNLGTRYLNSNVQFFANASDFAQLRPGPNVGVIHPVITAADTTLNCQIIGVPGSGKTTAVHDLLERTPDQPIITLSGDADFVLVQTILRETCPDGATVIIEDLHDELTTALVKTPLYQLKDIPNIRLIVTYNSPDAPRVREHWPQLAFFLAVDLDDGAVLRPLAAALAEQILPEMRADETLGIVARVEQWDGAAQTLVDVFGSVAKAQAGEEVDIDEPFARALLYWKGRVGQVHDTPRDVLGIIDAVRTLWNRPMSRPLIRAITRAFGIAGVDGALKKLVGERWLRETDKGIILNGVCADAWDDDEAVLREIIGATSVTIPALTPDDRVQLLFGVFRTQAQHPTQNLGDPLDTWKLLQAARTDPSMDANYAFVFEQLGDLHTAAELLTTFTGWSEDLGGAARLQWMHLFWTASMQGRLWLDLVQRGLAAVKDPLAMLGDVLPLLVQDGGFTRAADIATWSIKKEILTRGEVDTLLLHPPDEVDGDARKLLLQARERVLTALQKRAGA